MSAQRYPNFTDHRTASSLHSLDFNIQPNSEQGIWFSSCQRNMSASFPASPVIIFSSLLYTAILYPAALGEATGSSRIPTVKMQRDSSTAFLIHTLLHRDDEKPPRLRRNSCFGRGCLKTSATLMEMCSGRNIRNTPQHHEIQFNSTTNWSLQNDHSSESLYGQKHYILHRVLLQGCFY